MITTNNVDDFFNKGFKTYHEGSAISDDSFEMDEEYEDSNRYPLRSNGSLKATKTTSSRKRARVTKQNSLPKFDAFSPFLKSLNENHLPIIGREEEAQKIMVMIESGIRPLLLGPPGIGKESIIMKVSASYKQMNLHSKWQGKNIYSIGCRELIAANIDEQHAEGVVEQLKEVVEKHFSPQKQQSILYFKDIGSLMVMPKVVDFMHMLFKRPFPFIASMGTEITEEEIKNVTKILGYHYFSALEIKQSPLNEINEIVLGHLKNQNFEQIQCTEDSVDLAVRLSDKYIKGLPLPIKAIHILAQVGNELLLHSAKDTQVKIQREEIAKFISLKTDIPFEALMDDSIFNEQRFKAKLKENILGQDHAIDIVAEFVTSWKMGISHENKPWGVFLFAGPTGVGKTELAKQLAKHLYHNKEALIILDGSEYKESHTVSNLIGSPAGYVGHESGGMLTNALIQNPFRVVLFDEIEKAHPDVQKLFLQVFDRGTLTDRCANVAVDCKNTLFILTSNLGSSDSFEKGQETNKEKLIEILKPILVKHLSVEMCGRLDAIVPFMPIQQKHLSELATIELKKIALRLKVQAEIELKWTHKLVEKLAKIEVDLRFGGRIFCKEVEKQITKLIKNEMSSHQKRLKGKVLLDVSRGAYKVTEQK